MKKRGMAAKDHMGGAILYFMTQVFPLNETE